MRVGSKSTVGGLFPIVGPMPAGRGMLDAHIWCGAAAGEVTASVGCGTQNGPFGQLGSFGRVVSASGSTAGTQGAVCRTGGAAVGGAWVVTGAVGASPP